MPELKEKITSQTKLERPPALDRIVSADLTQEERQELIDYFGDLFKRQDIQELQGNEVELTPEQAHMVKWSSWLIL